MAQMNPSEFEEFQHLSDRYQADLPGPLIGDKLPIAALATEFAQADPAYVVKTAGLAATHSGYRAVKGDGQCGWRGVVYSYFEILLLMGNMQLLQHELVRIRSYEDTMKMAGIDYDIMVDMFDYTWEVFDDITRAIERQDKHDGILLNIFNDEIKSNSIVYHFKMMTSAYMQLRADQYEPFLEMPIHEYRVARIDPANQEIDQIGLQALTDGLIAPAGFGLEVLYLDRSYGEEVTPHQFSPDLQGCPTIQLLYRPGHYDIIYRNTQQHTTVFLQTSHPVPQGLDMPYETNNSTDLHDYLFPGGDTHFEPTSHHHNQSHYSSHADSSNNNYRYYYQDTPSYLMPDTAYQTHGHTSLPASTSFPPRPIQPSSSRSVTISPPPSSLTPTTSVGPSTSVASPSPTANSEPQIRLSAKCFNLQRHPSLPLDTRQHSGASLSPAHFRNEDFQPQMWKADEEYNTK